MLKEKIAACVIGVAALSSLATFAQERETLDAQLLWKYEKGDHPFSDPVVSGGHIFVGSEDHTLYALRADGPDVLWSYETGGKIHGAPLVTDEHVYFESDDRTLYKVTRESGTLVWSFEIEGTESVRDQNIFFHHTTSTPVLRDGNLYFGSGNSRFYCLNDEDGSEIWHFDAAGRIRSTPAFSNGKVFVVSFGPVVYALEAATGNLVWERPIPTPEDQPFWTKVLPSPVAYDDVVIMGFRNWNLQAFDATSGEVRWTVRYPNSWVEATGLIVDDRLYIGSSDATVVRCYNPRTGAIIWETNVGGRAYGAPSRFKHYLVFGLSGATTNPVFEAGVVALDRTDGRVAWRLSLEKPVSETFQAYGVLGETTVDEGVLYFSDESGSLYAYALDGAPSPH